ncbi:MAG TPA: hypothetical protein VGE31_01255, partial [Candidatus Paceibacterota bacterium]
MKNIITLALFSFALIIPQASQAYEVIDRDVTRLSDTLTMYTLEYKFGFLNADMWMPMMASKTVKEGNTTSSVVLSTAEIEDKKYFVPMGENATFTLLVIEEHAIGKSKGSVEVDRLPVTLLKKGDDEKMVRVFEGEE